MGNSAADPIFEHAMLREIYEQPRALAETIEHYAPQGGLMTETFRPWPMPCAAGSVL